MTAFARALAEFTALVLGLGGAYVALAVVSAMVGRGGF